MSYYMSLHSQKFFISQENVRKAYILLREWARSQELQRNVRNPLGNAKSFESAVHALGWEAECDDDGNICALHFDGGNQGNEEYWFDAIAPFVRKGSKLLMHGEEGAQWYWYFDGRHCVEYTGRITFPGLPED